MKKSIILFIAASLSLIACSSDDNKGATEPFPDNISFDALNINDKAPGSTVIATGKNLSQAKIGDYEILFRKTPTKPSEKSTSNSTKAIPIEEVTDGTVNATIYGINEAGTQIEFNIPENAGNGEVLFQYQKRNIRLTNYNYKK